MKSSWGIASVAIWTTPRLTVDIIRRMCTCHPDSRYALIVRADTELTRLYEAEAEIDRLRESIAALQDDVRRLQLCLDLGAEKIGKLEVELDETRARLDKAVKTAILERKNR
jgi:chromosome segregation ATPase